MRWPRHRGFRSSDSRRGEQAAGERTLEMVYWRGILNFSFDCFQDIARQAVHRMQRIDASGIFGDDYRHKTLWDEFCHEVQTGPTMLVANAMDLTVRPIVLGLVEALHRSQLPCR